MKRIVRTAAALLALVMLAASVPAAALAAGTKEVIKKVEIFGYTDPQLGAEPLTLDDLWVPDGAPYRLVDFYYSDGYYPEEAEEFLPGKSYDATFEIVSTDRNCILSYLTEVVVNGTQVYTEGEKEYERIARIENPILGNPIIEADFQGFVMPEKGMPAVADITCSDPDIRVLDSYWEYYDSEAGPERVSESDVFIEGEYALVIETVPDREKQRYIGYGSFYGTLNGEETDFSCGAVDLDDYTEISFFYIPVGEPIGEYEIKGFEYPELGKPCTSSVTLSGSEHCKASGVWRDLDSGALLGSSDVFGEDSGYYYELTLTCDEGYILTEWPIIKAGPSNENIMYSGYIKEGNSYISRSRRFDPRDGIEEINVYGVVPPRVGEVNNTDIRLSAASHCRANNVFWFCETDGRNMKPDEKFEAGKSYYLSFDLTADDGWCFWDSLIYCNGGSISLDGFSHEYEGKYGHSETVLYDLSTPENVTRLAGDDRVGTAIEISKAGFPEGAENVVIASGDGYADALAGVPLAYAMDAPILLVRGKTVDEGTAGEIERLGAKNIVILGGTGAVSADIEKKLSSLGKVTRIAGADRFETSALIAERLYELRGKPLEVLFACSHNYPDALAAGSPAALKGVPILYMAKDGSLSAPVKKYLEKHDIFRATIIGGFSAISENAEETLADAGIPNPDRIYGETRYGTCLDILETYRRLFDSDMLCAATGTNYPDALAGGVFAAKKQAPVLLVGETLDWDQLNYAEFREEKYVFGGTGALSDMTVNQLFGGE